MSARVRCAVAACAGLAALAFASTALAKYEPKLVVTSSGNRVTISATLANDDDTTAQIRFYAPTGWTANLGAAPGTELGPVEGVLNALDLDPPGGGLQVPVTGTVRTDDPAKYVANPCSPGPHQAVWLLALSAAGNALTPVPMYVDTTTGAETAFSSVKIVICLPPRDVPAGTPGRATLGVKLVSATFTTANVFTAGDSNRWTALFVPYAPGGATVNVPNAAESQAVVAAGSRLSLVAKKLKGRRVRLSGRLTTGGEGVAGGVVRLTASGKGAGSVRTNANGAFAKTLAVRKTTTFRARGAAAAREEQGGCDPVLPLPTGGSARCTVVTFGAVSATSNAVRVTVAKKKPKKTKARKR